MPLSYKKVDSKSHLISWLLLFHKRSNACTASTNKKKGQNKMLTLIYKIKLYLVGLKLKRLNNQYNKLIIKYNKKYLGI